MNSQMAKIIATLLLSSVVVSIESRRPGREKSRTSQLRGTVCVDTIAIDLQNNGQVTDITMKKRDGKGFEVGICKASVFLPNQTRLDFEPPPTEISELFKNLGTIDRVFPGETSPNQAQAIVLEFDLRFDKPFCGRPTIIVTPENAGGAIAAVGVLQTVLLNQIITVDQVSKKKCRIKVIALVLAQVQSQINAFLNQGLLPTLCINFLAEAKPNH